MTLRVERDEASLGWAVVDEESGRTVWKGKYKRAAHSFVTYRLSRSATPEGWQLPAGYVPSPPPSHCRSCGAEILWAVTRTGRRAPFNRDGTSHFSDCPQAAHWRGTG